MSKKISKNGGSNQPEEKKSETAAAAGTNAAKSRSLPARISLKILQIILLWIPAGIVSLFILVLIAFKLYLSPQRVENLIITNFNNLSCGTISLKVKDFSPYSGFEINNILIRNGEEFGKTKFVEIERLVLRYGLFSMLIGNIHFDEIGIYKPRIYLSEKGGVWNAARLMKPGEPKPEEPETAPEEGPPSTEINLPVSVEFLFKFILDDLQLHVDSSSYQSSVKGFTYTMDIWVPPFKRIPKSIEAVTLLKTMRLILNPQGEMDVYFSSKEAGIKTPLELTWKLIFDKKEGRESQFESMLKFGTYKAPVRFQKTHPAPLNFSVSYDLTFNPIEDSLKLSYLDVKFLDKNWLSLTGTVRQVTTKQEIYIRMAESAIILDDLYPYFASITGDRRTKFSGIISIYPLLIDGNPEYLNIDGEINLSKIYFKNPSTEADIPSLKLPLSVKKRSGDMKIALGIKIPHLFYTLEREKSGDNGIDLNADISALNNFQRVNINEFSFRFYNPVSKNNGLYLSLKGDVNLKPEMSGSINITKFTFVREPLLGMLPEKFRKSLAGVQITKPVDMNLSLKFALGADVAKANLGMLLKLPDYNINDLRLSADVIQNKKEKRIYLNGFALETKSLGLSIKALGTLDMQSPPFSDSDLKLSVKLNSPEMKPVYGPWKLSGLLELTAAMKGDLNTGIASGKLFIDKLFVKNDESKLSVEDINMDFPFEYSFKAAGPGESRIAVNKAQVIDNENFKARENFSIKSIKSKHPSRDIQFEYVKDFAATLFFKNNAFEIVKLKTYVLDGAVYGRDIIFNLADMPYTGSFKNVEYRLILDATNVDIGYLDNPDPKAKTRNAELSLNANFSGSGLDMFVGKGKDRSRELNVKGFININKVGKKFAKKLMQGLNEHKGESKLGVIQPVVDNYTTIKGFNFNLDMGLMYARVTIERRLLALLLTIEDIEYDRIPVQDYLNSLLGRQ